MDIFNKLKFADFAVKLYKNDFKKIAGYEFKPQKVEFIPTENQQGFLPRSTPEAQGVSSAHLEGFINSIAQSKDSNAHSVMVLRHGNVIMDANFKPYRKDYPHMLFSLSKSVVGIAVGIACDEGLISIDDKLVDIFPDVIPRFHNQYLDSITIKHFLTMSSGIAFNELGSATDKDWLKKYILSDIMFEPGTKFSYNSLNTYILSAIICKKSGMSLIDYLTPRLFEPLHIYDATWEVCPNGIEKGGWGLNLKIEDIAKIGQLYLQKGKWSVNGSMKQILSEEWVEQSSSKQIKTDKGRLSDSYGYQIWSFPIDSAYEFNGMFGQYVVIIPKFDVVVAVTAGSQNLFPEGSTFNIIRRYFSSEEFFYDKPLSTNKKALKSYVKTLKSLSTFKQPNNTNVIKSPIVSHLRQLMNAFKSKKEAPPIRQEIIYNNLEYSIDKIPSSLLPTVLQFVHGNFTDGIDNIKFEFEPNKYAITICEGENKNTVLSGKDGSFIYSHVNINGEVYCVGSTATWTTDEDNNDVLKLFVSFIETPNTRIFKFIFTEENLILKFDETPSVLAASNTFSSLLNKQTPSGPSIPIVDSFAKERIKEKVNFFTSPSTIGTLTNN